MGSIFTISILQSALNWALYIRFVVLALFVSFSILNIADLSTDGCFTFDVRSQPSVTIFRSSDTCVVYGYGCRNNFRFYHGILQTRMGVESILAGIIVNHGLYTINIAAMGFSSNMNLFKCDSIFITSGRDFIQNHMGAGAVEILVRKGWYKLILVAVIVIIVSVLLSGF